MFNQALQRADQSGDTLVALTLSIQHGAFQARHQGTQAIVEIALAQYRTQLLHAALDRRIAALDGETAAHQAAAQQVQACLPALLELLLPFQRLQVLFLPALGFRLAHGVPPVTTGIASPCSASGRRISTATGR